MRESICRDAASEARCRRRRVVLGRDADVLICDPPCVVRITPRITDWRDASRICPATRTRRRRSDTERARHSPHPSVSRNREAARPVCAGRLCHGSVWATVCAVTPGTPCADVNAVNRETRKSVAATRGHVSGARHGARLGFFRMARCKEEMQILESRVFSPTPALKSSRSDLPTPVFIPLITGMRTPRSPTAFASSAPRAASSASSTSRRRPRARKRRLAIMEKFTACLV